LLASTDVCDTGRQLAIMSRLRMSNVGLYDGVRRKRKSLVLRFCVAPSHQSETPIIDVCWR